jgi:hypothetical protein
LEAHWNRALQQIVDAQAIYERQRDADRVAVDADTRARILALATDFPRFGARQNWTISALEK